MKKPSIFLAILLILTIVFASLSVLEYTMPGVERTTTSTIVSTTTTTVEAAQSSTALWAVLKDNITLYGQMACMAINFGALGGCPTPVPSGNGTLGNVELITYNGSDYYSVTFPPVTNQGMPGSKPITYTVWFTNSTIFCAKPPIEFPALIYPVCP